MCERGVMFAAMGRRHKEVERNWGDCSKSDSFGFKATGKIGRDKNREPPTNVLIVHLNSRSYSSLAAEIIASNKSLFLSLSLSLSFHITDTLIHTWRHTHRHTCTQREAHTQTLDAYILRNTHTKRHTY